MSLLLMPVSGAPIDWPSMNGGMMQMVMDQMLQHQQMMESTPVA